MFYDYNYKMYLDQNKFQLLVQNDDNTQKPKIIEILPCRV